MLFNNKADVLSPVKHPPAMWETGLSLGWEDPLEKGEATHYSILAWRIPWTVQSMWSQRVGHDWETFTSLLHNKPGTLCFSWDIKMTKHVSSEAHRNEQIGTLTCGGGAGIQALAGEALLYTCLLHSHKKSLLTASDRATWEKMTYHTQCITRSYLH